MQITTLLSDQLARYLDLSSAEMKLTAKNMANVDLPGYRTEGMDFSAEVRRAMNEQVRHRAEMEGATGTAPGLAAGPAPAAGPNTGGKVFEVDGLLERPDGNNVSMDREGLKLAEEQLRFRTGVELLRHEYMRIQSAIQSDGK